MERSCDRRQAIAVTGIAAASLALGSPAHAREEEKEEEVGAVEDLMREHGVIRRAILVYRAVAARLRAGQALDPQPLRRTATLLRDFAEDYHERKLEEAHIFPAVKKAGGKVTLLVEMLIAQHRRGREITDYVLSAVKDRIRDPKSLAAALNGFELMYAHHAAREDTVVFPAWKKTLSLKQLDEMGEKFEEIEHQQFGKDGFDDAVAQITQVEASLGLADLAQFTPPRPKV
jgi:hemerythrin-like domain-containing protein